MDYTSAAGYVTDAQGRRQYVDRDIPNGIPGTALLAKDRNAVQNTLAAAIKAFGIALKDDDDTLLAQAITAAVASETDRAEGVEAALSEAVDTLSGYPVASTGTSPANGDSSGIIWVKTGTMCRLIWKEINVYQGKNIPLPFAFGTAYSLGNVITSPANYDAWVSGTVQGNTLTLGAAKQNGGTGAPIASGDGFIGTLMVEGVLAS
ncbi:hypothetical protein AA12717_0407 [Gluconacetobacter sacchari DSM 12717]|uniref:Uncharacterized protein n=1 Tax=Gluconacetobacter sacchari DSM 12717 TaxID=1307940 RepID=A0ABQ0P2Q6_9PROT|nr:hypothetical protein [Gluconacetobacter sacchari]GBQ19945.1 hypothetical protein AA12717_0407 [Gluconacetobacter sacchari DSM 12717]